MKPHFILSLAVCLLLTQGVPSLAQAPGEKSYRDHPEMPEGITGERIQAFFSTVNEFSEERLRAFLEAHCTEQFAGLPFDRHKEIFRGMHRETGRLFFHSIRTYIPLRPETVVIAKDDNFDSWRGITFHFEESGEKRIAGLNFSPARTPTDVEEPPLTEAQMIEKTTELLERLQEKDLFSGTVLIARGEAVLFEGAYGEASKRFHVPNNMDTKFNLGSMNKMFTATAIARLVEEGNLNYDDAISKYIDESWLPRSITDKVTIHHLLSHTSGLGSYFNETFWESSRDKFRELEDYKPLIEHDTLAFEPGERFQYSNTGMFLLGVIIESVTGETYFDHVQKYIHEPAGMTNTACYEMDRPVENLAIGYIPDPENPWGWQNNIYLHVLKGGPAGGGFSTVRDLFRFSRALTTGKLVGKASLEKMWTPQSEVPYGYGFSIGNGPAGRVVGHGGGFPGLNGNLDIFPDRDYTVAVLSNYDQGASPVASKIKEWIERLEEM